MSIPDNGGFDLVIALDVAKLDGLIRPIVNVPIPQQSFSIPNWGTLKFQPVVQLGAITLTPDGKVVISVTTSGSTFSWPRLVSLGQQVFPAGQTQFGVTVSVGGRPTGVGNEMRLEFDADAAQVTIDPGTLETIPAVQAYLATVDLLGTAQDVANARAALYRSVTNALQAPLNALIPSVVRLGHLPRPPVTAVETAVAGSELRFLMTIGGTRGNPAAITRSQIQRVPPPGDLAAVVLSNECLLRDIVRPALRAAFGLSPGGFVSSHPCLWMGTIPFPAATVSGIVPNLRSIRAGVDSSGMLRVRVSIDGQVGSGAYGLTGSFDLGFGASVVQNGPTRELRLTVANGGTIVRDLDIWIAWWVYVGGIFVSPTLVLITALTDALAGGGLAGAINGALEGAVAAIPTTLPVPDGPLSVSGLSMSQSDAPPRTFTMPGIPFTFFDDPLNDVIVRFSA